MTNPRWVACDGRAPFPDTFHTSTAPPPETTRQPLTLNPPQIPNTQDWAPLSPESYAENGMRVAHKKGCDEQIEIEGYGTYQSLSELQYGLIRSYYVALASDLSRQLQRCRLIEYSCICAELT